MDVTAELHPWPECEQTRRTITEVAVWFSGLQFLPMPEDPDYEEQMANLGNELHRATEAFANRPEACHLQDEGDDKYSCEHCRFNVHIDSHSV